MKPVETAETIPDGHIILVAEAREKMAQYQVEIVAMGLPDICEDKHCERPHHGVSETCADGYLTHIIPDALCVGAWCLVKPRSYIAADDLTDLYLVRQDCVEAVFRVTAD